MAVVHEDDERWVLGMQVSNGPYLLEVLAGRGAFVDRWAQEAVRLALRAQAGR
jgi:hypothetical protein